MSVSAAQKVERIVDWLAAKVAASGLQGLVVGLSGGVDSALAAQLIARACPGRALGLIMPADSDPRDRQDGIAAATAAKLPYLEIDLSDSRRGLYEEINAAMDAAGLSGEATPLGRGNLGARLRMATLYAVAGRLHYLVVGTDNAAEWYTGYFTKYGDGGVDLLPLAHLTKGDIYELARYLGVPSSILCRPPSAGFFAGQSDEAELGVPYAVIDAYLRGEQVSPTAQAQIERLHAAAAHKLEPLPRLTTSDEETT